MQQKKIYIYILNILNRQRRPVINNVIDRARDVKYVDNVYVKHAVNCNSHTFFMYINVPPKLILKIKI